MIFSSIQTELIFKFSNFQILPNQNSPYTVTILKVFWGTEEINYIFLILLFLELESWSISMKLFDDEEVYLRRPENPAPLNDEAWARRRRLLHQLGNQLTRFLVQIQTEDRKIKNNVAKQNPIVIN